MCLPTVLLRNDDGFPPVAIPIVGRSCGARLRVAEKFSR